MIRESFNVGWTVGHTKSPFEGVIGSRAEATEIGCLRALVAVGGSCQVPASSGSVIGGGNVEPFCALEHPAGVDVDHRVR